LNGYLYYGTNTRIFIKNKILTQCPSLRTRVRPFRRSVGHIAFVSGIARLHLLDTIDVYDSLQTYLYLRTLRTRIVTNERTNEQPFFKNGWFMVIVRSVRLSASPVFARKVEITNIGYFSS